MFKLISNYKGEIDMEKTFNILSYDHLVKLNNKAKKNNKNQYVAEDVIDNLMLTNCNFVVVSFQFPHNEVEQRLVLFAGEQYQSLLLDVDFEDLKLITEIKTPEMVA